MRSLKARAALSLLLVGSGTLAFGGTARAQIVGTTNRQLPNVLLLVDNSGSMERMSDNSLPSQNRNVVGPIMNACSPGVESNPNRWGMLLQALTGNIQPFFSCDAEVRTSNSAFDYEFRINDKKAYDVDYFLPYHRPLAGAIAPTDKVCAMAPWKLPGAGGGGVGPAKRGAGGNAEDFPADALMQVYYTPMRTAYAANTAYTPTAANGIDCLFEQANDGQLDLSRDFVRFALMTFDNDGSEKTSVSASNPAGGAYDTVNPFFGMWSYISESGAKQGYPANCSTPAFFEVGARHRAAPPWEGRMVGFPSPFATLFDVQRTNDEIQKVLVATRPYGATPIDGMLDDAKDYLTANTAWGPWSNDANTKDDYVKGGCRDQYIILLTDGAPNMDMRPSCEGGGGDGPPPAGKCPYKKRGWETAQELYNNAANTGKHVQTFVIGFSVNGSGDFPAQNDGFPSGLPTNTCKDWYNSTAPTGGKGNPKDMDIACGLQNPPKGSTGDACCQLNKIALYGSGGPAGANTVGPFFAESQRDLALAFGSVLASITKVATTRTVPGYSPVSVIGAGPSSDYVTGRYVASFIPNTQKVWSGEIDRTRTKCNGLVVTDVPQSTADGDSYALNTAAQAVAGRRLFISYEVDPQSAIPGPGNARDSAGTIRPFVPSATPGAMPDAISTLKGKEVGATDMGILSQMTEPAVALDIDDNTCKKSKGVNPITRATVDIPKLPRDRCTDMIWGFTTAHKGSLFEGTAYDFNIRCNGTGSFAAGKCSFSGSACTVGSGGGTPCAIPGEVCVPDCSALGAVFRSSPIVVGPPDALLRDQGFRNFQRYRRGRRPTMFVSTADGILHAFKALPDDPATPTVDHEMWAFIPPAVLPKLASNYPSGAQILLDGTAAVKEVVWERPGDSSALDDTAPGKGYYWHTSLVSGMGSAGGGYYSLNVTDADCTLSDGAPVSAACLDGANGYKPAASFAEASANGADTAKKGPHFMWQITDFEQQPGDPAKPTRKAKNGKQMVALFGSQSATPAITTLQIKKGATQYQVGVAILPGGIDGPPVKGGSCGRAVRGNYGGFGSSDDLSFTSPAGFKARDVVRQWGANCNTSPVPGRGVTIVRLDTGDIIRHFGRRTQDVPKVLLPVTKDAPFDSPIIGTPLVYPNQIGVAAQKIYVGDADGTIWRIDVSSPDPTQWDVQLFQDLIAPAGAANAAASQPINVPMVLSQSPTGSLVLNAATGDQENIVASSTERNYVFSIEELRPDATSARGKPNVRWYQNLDQAKRVTGPMVVFDRAVYFATYRPELIGSLCGNTATTELWGMDFYTPADTSDLSKGGVARWCPRGSVQANGTCGAALAQYEDVSNDPDINHAIIPGVSLRATQACATYGAQVDQYGSSITAMQGTEYHLFFGVTGKRGANPLGTDQANRLSVKRQLPRISTSIDAWTLVVD
jgi:type IV pilus assembly protein PilY1